MSEHTRTPIGWVGLGKMGAPMALNLVKAGWPVTVFNRTREKTRPLAEAGAAVADEMAAAGAGAVLAFTMISDDAALEASSAALLSTMKPGGVLVDMSTVSPEASARVADAAAARDIACVRAPVSGSVTFAEAGSLTILASGPREAYARCLPAFETMGGRVYHVGEAEEARYIKLTLNMLVGITAGMAAEALTLSEKAGVDWETLLDVVGNSAAASPLIGYKLNALKSRDFAPAFAAEQMAKDFDLMLDAGRRANVPLPLTALVRQHWSAMLATGRGGNDFFGCLELIEEQAGLTARAGVND